MPSLKAIRKRIASTKATQKITRAMKMVAGARLTRAQQRIVAMRPYAVKTSEVLHSVARTMRASAENDDSPHPLLTMHLIHVPPAPPSGSAASSASSGSSTPAS